METEEHKIKMANLCHLRALVVNEKAYTENNGENAVFLFKLKPLIEMIFG